MGESSQGQVTNESSGIWAGGVRGRDGAVPRATAVPTNPLQDAQGFAPRAECDV